MLKLLSAMDMPCNACSATEERPAKGKWGIATGLFMAILPKCPFCMVAYSSTAMLCGEGVILESTTTHTSPVTIIFSALLGLVTLVSIALNQRGARTRYAFSISLLGCCMVLTSVIWVGGLLMYYAGVLFVFAGVWLNGSFYWAWRQLKPLLPGSSKQLV